MELVESAFKSETLIDISDENNNLNNINDKEKVCCFFKNSCLFIVKIFFLKKKA